MNVQDLFSGLRLDPKCHRDGAAPDGNDGVGPWGCQGIAAAEVYAGQAGATILEDNAFDLIVNAGTLSTTDPEVEINNPASEASANDLADLMKATTFDVVWTAPLTSSANIEIWGVMGDGAGSMVDIWDREVYSYTAVPEFPMILLPIVGIGLAIILASRESKKR